MKAKRSILVLTMLVMPGLPLAGCADAKLMTPTPSLDILQVLPASAILVVGDTASLGAQHIQGRVASNVTMMATWHSDDESIVTVSYDAEAGAVVTAVGPGTAHVVATANGSTGTAEFVVTADVASIELDKGSF